MMEPFHVPEVIVPRELAVPANLTLPALTRIDQGLVMVADPAARGALSMYKVAALSIVTADASVIVGW